MIRVKYSWLIVLLAGLCWGCQETEVLETYEQVKETTQPVPIAFNPYVLSQPEISADTRADLSYLSYIQNTNTNNLYYFNFIPCLGLKAGTANSWGRDAGTAAGNKAEYNFRFGRTSTNSYIVGVYAFSHGSSSWATVASSATANLMTNQPLLRVPNKTGENSFAAINGLESGNGNARKLNQLSHWDYEPKKYWPGNGNVTFVAYYPYQDFVGGDYYRDGTDSRPNEHVTLSGVDYWDPDDENQENEYDDADLTCITPPAADATGTDAYTFKFRQLNNVQKHIDFLLGIKTDQTKENVTDSVRLQLKHTLCGVQFNFENLGTNWGLQTGQTGPKEIKIKVNSIGFKGLYTKGDVYPDGNGNILWKDESLTNYNATEITKYGSDENAYMVTFDDNTGGDIDAPFMMANVDDRPTFTYSSSSGKWTTVNQTSKQIYNKGDFGGSPIYGGNSRGFRYLLLVIPQTVNNNDNAYFVMDYDYSYTWAGANGDEKVSFKHTISKIRLSDSAKSANKTKLFIAGKLLTFKVKITPAGIGMDVQETDWDDALDRQLPVDEKEIESGS